MCSEEFYKHKKSHLQIKPQYIYFYHVIRIKKFQKTILFVNYQNFVVTILQKNITINLVKSVLKNDSCLNFILS